MSKPIGLIAGQGRLPINIAEGIHRAGLKVACVGLADQFDEDLPEHCDMFATAGIIRMGRWIRLLRRWGAAEVIMVGRVRKARMYEPMRIFRQLPDLRAAKVWYRVLRHDKRTEKLLQAVADELAAGGIRVVESTRYIAEHMATSGVMTRTQPNATQRGDIEFALPIVAGLNELDVGQGVAVRDREVIAVEAIEGTDRMIERAGELCKMGGWTLVKTAKRDQDFRFDVPTVGERTIAKLKEHGGKCLAVETGKVIIVDKPKFLEAADAAGIAVVGVEI